jgi:AraC-like DNA-binding protein
MTDAPADNELNASVLLETSTLTIRDVTCSGTCRHKSPTECASATHLVFPYRGVFVRHVGGVHTVAEANQLVFFNDAQEYAVSHPVGGGDACLSISIDQELLRELSPGEQLADGAATVFRAARRAIDPRAQALVALLRHGLTQGTIETLEAETLVLTLVRRSLGERTSHAPTSSYGRQKLVDRTKLLLATDPTRRWTLAGIACEIGVSPVYLTQVFAQVEGIPLYRYQLRLRLARALDLLADGDDLTSLGLHLGFSSHSHFSAAFRQLYGRTPAEFRRAVLVRQPRG